MLKFTLYRHINKENWEYIISSEFLYSIDSNNMPYPSFDEIVHIGFYLGISSLETKRNGKKWYYLTDFVTKILKRSKDEIIFETNSDKKYKLSITAKKFQLKDYYGFE